MTRGFALGGGGARGLAHIGILQELEQNSIAVDYLAGTSAGAVIGALYASGMSLAEIETLALHATWRDVIAIHPTCRSFLSGKRLLTLLERHCRARRFEDLPIPFAAVAADFQTGESVAFTQGELFPAVLASCSIPAVFPPTVINGRQYIDGGFTEEQIPVATVKNMGSDLVVACDVNYHAGSVRSTKTFVTLLFHLFLLTARNNARKAKQHADVIINVEVGGMSLIKFQQAQELIRRGRQATADVIPKLRESV